MQLQRAYRIVEIKNGHPHTLFHGVNGRRHLPVNQWVRANKTKLVRDGTGPWYVPGFNVLLEEEGCRRYLERFTAPRKLKVVPVWVNSDLRRKEHSPSNVFLADWMFLDWPYAYDTQPEPPTAEQPL